MCWNASVSINTYILGTFACVFAYKNNIISLTTLLFYQSFICMQLIEYFIWSKTFSNKTMSQLAYILIVLQPIFALLCIEDKKIKVIGLTLYILFIIPSFIMPWSSVEFRSSPGSNGHLAWYWAKFSLPVLIIWSLFLTLRIVLNKDWLILILLLGALLTSYVLYHKTYTWGSMWCWVANMISLVLIYKVFAKEFCKP